MAKGRARTYHKRKVRDWIYRLMRVTPWLVFATVLSAFQSAAGFVEEAYEAPPNEALHMTSGYHDGRLMKYLPASFRVYYI